MFSLRDRLAQVIGAGGHLRTALALAEPGGRVVVTSRDLRYADAVAKSLPSPDGAEHFGVVFDQTDAALIEDCMHSNGRGNC